MVLINITIQYDLNNNFILFSIGMVKRLLKNCIGFNFYASWWGKLDNEGHSE